MQHLKSATSYCGDEQFAFHCALCIVFWEVMDSPAVNRIFRQLFAHETCSRTITRRPRLRHASVSASSVPVTQTRGFLWTGEEGKRKTRRYGGRDEEKKDQFWKARQDLLLQDHTEDYMRFPLVTADHLRPRKERPRRVKMTVRDFIEGMRDRLMY